MKRFYLCNFIRLNNSLIIKGINKYIEKNLELYMWEKIKDRF